MCNYESNKNQCLQLGMKAPDFSAVTTFGQLKFSELKGKWVVLFSHPADFTPVCSTEFVSFARHHQYFEQLNVQLLGLSIDSNPAHLAWVYNIYQNTGIRIPFPIIADQDGYISWKYGMIAEKVSTKETIRSVFIIDEEQIIRAILTYPLTNGRNIPEILRLVDALQTTDREEVVTPANWIPGYPVLVPPPMTYEGLLERKQCPGELRCLDWYWCYKQPNKCR